MPRRCNDVCGHLKHVKSLRWVSKYDYKYCSKCAKYFKTTRIQCECCKDTLRVYYKPEAHVNTNLKRIKKAVINRLYYIEHIDYWKIWDVVNHDRHNKIKARSYDKYREKINSRRREKYKQQKLVVNLR